jgi:hypothetical protein
MMLSRFLMLQDGIVFVGVEQGFFSDFTPIRRKSR